MPVATTRSRAWGSLRRDFPFRHSARTTVSEYTSLAGVKPSPCALSGER